MPTPRKKVAGQKLGLSGRPQAYILMSERMIGVEMGNSDRR